MAAFTAAHAAGAAPGTRFRYSSGDSNVLAAALRGMVGEQAYVNYPWNALFEPLGITSAVWERDGAGTFVASSYAYMTARDLARVGLLMQRDGRWGEGNMQYGRLLFRPGLRAMGRWQLLQAILLFAGAPPSPDLMAGLRALGSGAVPMRLVILRPAGSTPFAVEGATVLEDAEGLARERYDGGEGGFYLIRPDQHVCARWRAADPARVRAALARASGNA